MVYSTTVERFLEINLVLYHGNHTENFKYYNILIILWNTTSQNHG